MTELAGRVISLLPESPAPAPQLLPWAGVLGKVFKEGVRAHVQLANSVYCGALRWVVRFSPTQAAGTERSPVMMPTTSSFYKGPPRKGKPPTDAGLSSKAKCTQALLLNLSSRLCLHGGWDLEGGATFGVWTDSGAVVGVWAGPGPGTQETSPAGRRWRGISNPRFPGPLHRYSPVHPPPGGLRGTKAALLLCQSCSIEASRVAPQTRPLAA